MPRRFFSILPVVLSLVFISSCDQDPVSINTFDNNPEPDEYAAEIETQLYTQINSFRAENDLGPYILINGLSDVARAHSQDMLDRDYISHDTPDGLSHYDRIVAGLRRPIASARENIWTLGSNYPQDCAACIASQAIMIWRASDEHLANMLLEIPYVGYGVAISDEGVRITMDIADF